MSSLLMIIGPVPEPVDGRCPLPFHSPAETWQSLRLGGQFIKFVLVDDHEGICFVDGTNVRVCNSLNGIDLISLFNLFVLFLLERD